MSGMCFPACRIAAFCFVIFLSPAYSQKQVRQIVIKSQWRGFAPIGSTPPDANVTIVRTATGYTRDGHQIAPALVDALVAAIQSPPATKPDPEHLGITPSWLASHVSPRVPQAEGYPGDPTTPGQRALFQKSFTDMKLIARVLPKLFANMHTDDFPSARFEIVFDDDSRLSAFSGSQFAYMLPWCIGPQRTPSYNPAISRAVAALLPARTVNKDRLADDDLAGKISDEVMEEIRTAYDLRGSEDRVGPDLARLSRSYDVVAATIDSSISDEYGPDEFDPKREEVNLHATLHKGSMLPNVSDEVTLLNVHDHIQGIDKFLASEEKYGDLVLSVPWLKQYLMEHPSVTVGITYVHDASMGDDALRKFDADMKVRERGDLIEKVRAQQKQIALLRVGERFEKSYWIVFPDGHLLLWRYQGPSGLLKWSPSDFGEGECSGLGIFDGGCSGREVSPDGILVPEGTPRDVACVQAWSAANPKPAASQDALFEVEKNDRAGFIDRTGAVVIPLCFESVQEFSEGLAPFERDSRWGYINESGHVVIQPVFSWAEEFHEGLAHVQVTGRALDYQAQWGYIDKSGNLAISAIFPKMIEDDEGDKSAFHEGLAIVDVWDNRIPPRKGFIDRAGKLLIPARFTYVEPFSEGLAAATESEGGKGGWGFIDRTGNWVIPPEFEWAGSFHSGYAPINRKHDCGFIDHAGTRVGKISSASPTDCGWNRRGLVDGLSPWKSNSLYGFIDRNGNTAISPRFDLAFEFSEGLAAVQIGKRWGFLDTVGRMVIPPQDFSNVRPFHNGLSRVVVEKGGIGYIDRTGKFIWGPYEPSEGSGK